jgi:glycosyltransferase involved in cell wall biosynthesis
MKIGIDALTVGESLLPAASGMRIYVTGLVAAMAEVSPADEIVVFEAPYVDLHELSGIPNVHRVRCVAAPRHRGARVLYQNTVFPLIVNAARLDVFLATANVLPIGLDRPAIVVVQGLQWFDTPQAFNGFRGRYLRVAARNAARRAKRLVAVSNVARTDATHYLGVPETKIRVIHHGISEPIRRRSQSSRADVAPLERYILNVGAFYHHKNQLRLIDAFAEMRSRWRLNYRLRIIGPDADLSRSDMRAHATRAGVEEFVDLLGPVDHGDIWTHYANAALFVYPSLYETFGHPPLEAMVARCPVIASNSSAIPEVVGDAALLVDAEDVASIADAMGSVLSDSELRQRLVAKGAERVNNFSWQRAASAYLEVLTQACQPAVDPMPQSGDDHTLPGHL